MGQLIWTFWDHALKLWPFNMLYEEQGNENKILTLQMFISYTSSSTAFLHLYTHTPIFITATLHHSCQEREAPSLF